MTLWLVFLEGVEPSMSLRTPASETGVSAIPPHEHLVLPEGLEPPRLAALASKTSVSAIPPW